MHWQGQQPFLFFFFSLWQGKWPKLQRKNHGRVGLWLHSQARRENNAYRNQSVTFYVVGASRSKELLFLLSFWEVGTDSGLGEQESPTGGNYCYGHRAQQPGGRVVPFLGPHLLLKYFPPQKLWKGCFAICAMWWSFSPPNSSVPARKAALGYVFLRQWRRDCFKFGSGSSHHRQVKVWEARVLLLMPNPWITGTDREKKRLHLPKTNSLARQPHSNIWELKG